MPGIIFPPEWFRQSGVQLTWPHKGTDWSEIIDEVTDCYVAIAKEILKREKLLIVCPVENDIINFFNEEEQKNLRLVNVESNDTWARDHGAISLFINDKPTIADFGFNAWGLKFPANHDNRITRKLYELGTFQKDVVYTNLLDFILEGGSIETDGNGTLMTTTECLLAPNRNQPMEKPQIDAFLKKSFGVTNILWLDHGFLEGDDTDNHIDTLARFCNERTIVYVKCEDEKDLHFNDLQKMEEQLKGFTDIDGNPYELIALPMADAVYEDGERLPATYANFLIINGAVLLPFYGSEKDMIAKSILQKVFPDREVIGIDCGSLIKQHGSLHCITMQFPEGFL
jgi:agmatine/peptidylarginine deiminase